MMEGLMKQMVSVVVDDPVTTTTTNSSSSSSSSLFFPQQQQPSQTLPLSTSPHQVGGQQIDHYPINEQTNINNKGNKNVNSTNPNDVKSSLWF